MRIRRGARAMRYAGSRRAGLRPPADGGESRPAPFPPIAQPPALRMTGKQPAVIRLHIIAPQQQLRDFIHSARQRLLVALDGGGVRARTEGTVGFQGWAPRPAAPTKR